MPNGLFIPTYCDLPDHPRFQHLCRLLGCKNRHDENATLGQLLRFWLWVMRYYPDGTVTTDINGIAYASGYTDEPAVWVDALKASGFLAHEENGIYSVHNWEEYGGALVTRRNREATRQQEKRKKNTERCATNAGHTQDVAQRCATYAPEKKIKRKSKKEKDKTDLSHPADATRESPSKKEPFSEEQFEELWNTYPSKRRTTTKNVRASLKTALKASSFKIIIDALRKYTASPRVQEHIRAHTEQFIPMLTVWLNGELWTEDPAAWQVSHRAKTQATRHDGPIKTNNREITPEEIEAQEGDVGAYLAKCEREARESPAKARPESSGEG